MNTIKKIFTKSFKQYMFDNNLIFGKFKNSSEKYYLSTVENHNALTNEIVDLEIDNLDILADKNISFDKENVVAYINTVLSIDNDKLHDYVLVHLEKFGSNIDVMKYVKDNNIFLKLLNYPYIEKSSVLDIKDLQFILSNLTRIELPYESELLNFVKNKKKAFKKTNLQIMLINFVQNQGMDVQPYNDLFNINLNNDELFIEDKNETFTFNIKKTSLYAFVSIDNAINKNHYWKMLRNICAFYNSPDAKNYGFIHAYIDNYNDSLMYFKLIIECNEKNILNKKEIQEMTTHLFASFPGGLIGNAIVETLTKTHKKDYNNICHAFILDKKIPNKTDNYKLKMKI